MSVCAIAALIFCVLTGALAQGTGQQKPAEEKTATVQGRVLAIVEMYLGGGLGPQWDEFVFGVEPTGSHGKQVAPIKVMYAYNDPKGKLGGKFFDHAKLYEFQLERDRTCDETVAKVSQVENRDLSGKVAPYNALGVLDGAPKDLLKLDLVLPCYVLRHGKYKVVSQDKQQSAVRPVIDPKTGDLYLDR